MTNAQYRAQQRRLMEKMKDVSIRVLFAADMPDPPIRILRSRNRASVQLANYAVRLSDSIYAQLGEALKK